MTTKPPSIRDLYGFDPTDAHEEVKPLTPIFDNPTTLPEDPLAALATARHRPLDGFISRICDTCGNRFTLRHTRQIYCTSNCARRAMRNRKRLHDEKVRQQQLLALREGQQHQD